MTKGAGIPRKPTRILTDGEIEQEVAGIRAGLEMAGVPFTAEAEAAARVVLEWQDRRRRRDRLRTRRTERPRSSVSNDWHYPGTEILRNFLGCNDFQMLPQVESLIVATRTAELAAKPIDGAFDFEHLQAIHRYLLDDLYDWAGEIRTIDIVPGDLGILRDPSAAIPQELDRVFADINSGVYLNHHSHAAFVQDLAGHWGDLTSIHPFVAGNFRAQRVFFDQLARDVGWAIEWRELSVDAVQAARNFAYVDGGTILADVLRPVIKPVTEVRADS